MLTHKPVFIQQRKEEPPTHEMSQDKKPANVGQSRGATPKIRPESSISRVLNFGDADTKLRPTSDVTTCKLSKSASSSPSHGKLQHQSSQPASGSFRIGEPKSHPIRPSASASNVAGVCGAIQLRKSSYKSHQSHSLRYSGSGTDVSNLVRVKNSTLGKSAPSLSANVVSSASLLLGLLREVR